MRKHKCLFIIIAISTLVVASVTTLAYVNYSGVFKTQVTTGSLHVGLSQNKLELDMQTQPVMPLDEFTKELYVCTSGTYNQYLRFEFYRYWTDLSDGYQIAPDCDPKFIRLNLSKPDDFISFIDPKNKGKLTLYYKYPVSPNNKIKIIKSIGIDNIPSVLQNNYAHFGIQIDAKVDSIQQIGTKNNATVETILDVWNVRATIDEHGTICNIV